MTRFGAVMVTYFATMAIGVSAFVHPAPKLIWNASASVPIGLYRVRPAGDLHVTDLVVVRAPEPLANFLAERGYLPRERAPPEAHPGAPRTNRLPHGTHNHRRCHRHRRGARP